MILRDIMESRVINTVIYYDLYEKLYYKLRDKYQWSDKFSLEFAIEPTFFKLGEKKGFVVRYTDSYKNRSLFNSTLYLPATETAEFLRAVLEYRMSKVLKKNQIISFSQPWVTSFLFDHFSFQKQIDVEYQSLYHWWAIIDNVRFFRNELPCEAYRAIDSLLVKLASEMKGYKIFSEYPIPEFPVLARYCKMVYLYYVVVDDKNLYIIPKSTKYKAHSIYPLKRIESKEWLYNKFDRYSLFGDLDDSEKIIEEIYNDIISETVNVIPPIK